MFLISDMILYFSLEFFCLPDPTSVFPPFPLLFFLFSSATARCSSEYGKNIHREEDFKISLLMAVWIMSLCFPSTFICLCFSGSLYFFAFALFVVDIIFPLERFSFAVLLPFSVRESAGPTEVSTVCLHHGGHSGMLHKNTGGRVKCEKPIPLLEHPSR